jgi:hypothetical protein
MKCGHATIKPDADSAGHHICFDPYQTLYEWERRDKVRNSESAVWVGRILTVMAGAEAVAEPCTHRSGDHVGDGDDRYQIALMLENLNPPDADRYEARLRKMARMLVRRHRERIERVADALLKRGRLSAKQLDRLTGRSVADVKVNAPLLLTMHSGPD